MFGAFAAFTSGLAFAQSAEVIKNSPDWVRASVVTDGGAVYSGPDFDAKVSDYLALKTPLYISKKAVPGNGGLGLFHRVRYKNKSGFMADTDIRMVNKEAAKEAAESEKAKGTPKKMRSKTFADDEEKPNKENEPFYFRRYVGGAFSMLNFSEKFSGTKLSSNVPMVGLRMTGPGALFDGPPLDFNFWYSLTTPKYYSNFSTTTGFFLFGDIMAMLPFLESGPHMIYYGLGMMYTYTRFKVLIKNSTFDSQEIRIGADLDVGYGYRFGHFALRTDLKYYYEKTQYFGYLVSFQTEY